MNSGSQQNRDHEGAPASRNGRIWSPPRAAPSPSRLCYGDFNRSSRSPGGVTRTLAFLPWLLSGCSRAPSFDIIGSFFPAWLVCLVIGILLAALGRWLLLRQQIMVVWPILVYPSLAALFTFLFWLLFFS